jgi:hypothetical protein
MAYKASFTLEQILYYAVLLLILLISMVQLYI